MWIIVIIVILILAAIYSWFGTQINIFSDMIDGNIFTILALISAAIGGIYFWASSKSYKDYKIKEKIMGLLEGTSNSDNLPAKREIDLSSVNLQSLVKNMEQMLTSPTPIFFKGWGNKRLKLDVERVGLMNDYIQNVIAAGRSFVRLKADALISYEKIQLLAETELNRLREEAQRSKYSLMLLEHKYENELTRLKTDTEKMKMSIEELKLDRRIKEEEHDILMKERQSIIVEREELSQERKGLLQLQKDKTEAEIYCMKVKSHDESLLKNKIGDLFDKIIEDLKFDNLTPAQVIILISLFGSGNASNVEDFEMKKKMMDQEIERMRQENEFKKHEARGKYYDTEHKNYKYEKERANFG